MTNHKTLVSAMQAQSEIKKHSAMGAATSQKAGLANGPAQTRIVVVHPAGDVGHRHLQVHAKVRRRAVGAPQQIRGSDVATAGHKARRALRRRLHDRHAVGVIRARMHVELRGRIDLSDTKGYSGSYLACRIGNLELHGFIDLRDTSEGGGSRRDSMLGSRITETRFPLMAAK
jgi:hypothetical protein